MDDSAPRATIHAEQAGDLVATDTRPVHSELDHLHGAIDTAEELLGILTDRLRPVLRESGEVGKLIAEQVEPMLSPIAMRTRASRLRVLDLSDRVRDLLDRLEV